MSEPRLVLASGSPRRRELLEREGIEFEVVTSHVEEVRHESESPVEYARRLACEKAIAVYEKLRKPVRVLGADTVVIVDGLPLEKPVDAQDATRMLKLLSGRAHEVVTAVSLIDHRGADLQHATTVVRFRRLTYDEIGDYVGTGEPFDKAGAYGIQGGAAKFVESIEGDYNNVVGLPVYLVREMLQDTVA